MDKVISAFIAVVIIFSSGILVGRSMFADQFEKETIKAWCRQPVIEKIHDGGRWSDEPVSLVYYEDCIKKKPDWWPKEEKS